MAVFWKVRSMYIEGDRALSSMFQPYLWRGGLPLFLCQKCGWVDTWMDIWVDKIELSKTKCVDQRDIQGDTFNIKISG